MSWEPIPLSGQSIYPSANKPERASILMIVLWSLCLLSAFAVILGYNVRQKLALVKRLDEKEALRLIAEAGARKAYSQLMKEEEDSSGILNEAWSDNPAEFKERMVGGGSFSVAYNLIDERSGGLMKRYGLIDEERKININRAAMNILERLFKISAGLSEIEAQELAASIIDWRDNDSELSLPLGSAEDSYYRNLRYPYEARDADFEVLDEMLLVKGMTNEIFEKLKSYVTIYGSGRVNINTAPKAVLLALGFSEDIADAILLFRYGEGGNDDSSQGQGGVFDAVSDIVPKISQFYHLSPSELTQVSAIAEQALAVSSDNFMVKSSARMPNRKNYLEITSVIDRKGKILYWNEI